MLAGVLLLAAPWRCGLPELQYLDAPVRPLPDFDRHVLRAEGAPDAHPAVLPVDQVALELCQNFVSDDTQASSLRSVKRVHA